MEVQVSPIGDRGESDYEVLGNRGVRSNSTADNALTHSSSLISALCGCQLLRIWRCRRWGILLFLVFCYSTFLFFFFFSFFVCNNGTLLIWVFVFCVLYLVLFLIFLIQFFNLTLELQVFWHWLIVYLHYL